MKGKVISRSKTGALTIALLPEENDACSVCSLGDTCGLPKASQIEVEPGPETEKLQDNDFVDVEITSRKLLWLSGSVYILPLGAMLTGALLGAPYGENMSIAFAFGGAAIGIMFNVFLNKRLTLNRIVTLRRIG